MKIVKLVFVLLLLIFVSIPVIATQRVYSEKTYHAQWCKSHNGIMEYRLSDDTLVDCLTDTLAVEFDFANKWAECIGQSQYYGLKTNKQSACVLIMERDEKDIKYLKRLRKVAYKKGIRTFTMKPEQIK